MINLREWALPVYTIMMQMAAGGMLILWVIYTQIVRHDRTTADRVSHNLVMFMLITISTAMIGSHFHLSRPYLSFLAVRNIKTSWLSREIAFTVAFAVQVSILWLLQRYKFGPFRLRLATGWSAVITGLGTVYCMSRVYLLPTQIAWNSITTPVAFFSASFLLGGMAISALLLMNLYLAALRDQTDLEPERHFFQQTLAVISILVVAAASVELVNYGVQIRALSAGDASAHASLDLLLGLYSVLFGIRLGLLGFGVMILVGVVLWQRKTAQPLIRLLPSVYFTFLLLLVGEVLGRFLFYAIHVRTGI